MISPSLGAPVARKEGSPKRTRTVDRTARRVVTALDGRPGATMASETSQPRSPDYIRCTPAARIIFFALGERDLETVQRGSRRQSNI